MGRKSIAGFYCVIHSVSNDYVQVNRRNVNLLYLMKPGYPKYLTSIEEGKCTEYLRLGINNRELDDFLDPFIKGNIICDNGCEKCQYCKRISEKIIYDKEWICDFKKFLFKEIEKRYT